MLKKLRESILYLPVFVIAVFIYALITNYNTTTGWVSALTSNFVYVLTRFFIGFGMAYFLSFPVAFLERRLKLKPAVAIAIVYLLFISVSTYILIYIVPLIVQSVEQVLAAMPRYLASTQSFIENYLTSSGYVDADWLSGVYENLTGKLLDFAGGLLNTTVLENMVRSTSRLLMNLGFGLIISIYALLDRKSLKVAAKRVLYALISKTHASRTVLFIKEADRFFSKFLIGKLLDSLIIGVLSLILYLIFPVPMAPFMALIAGVTNMVPYFGPLVGGIISVLILMCFNPISALYAAIIIIVLQCLDGWIIGPKILGDACGISPLLTVVAITLGGDFFGIWGIVLGVPAVATIKTVLVEQFLAKKLEKKRIETDAAGAPVTAAAPENPGDRDDVGTEA